MALLIIALQYAGFNAVYDNFREKLMFMGMTESPIIHTEFMVISGLVDKNGKISVYPIYTTRNKTIQDCPNKGVFSIGLYDAEENLLFSSFFSTESISVIQRDGSDRTMNSGQFLFKIPFYKHTEKITIKKESLSLWEKMKSKNVPNVSFLKPKNGESVKGENINIAIEANDKDLDKLYFIMEYSSDDEQTWNSLTGLFTDRVLQINTSQFSKGDKIILSLLCTDGFNTQRDNASINIMQ